MRLHNHLIAGGAMALTVAHSGYLTSSQSGPLASQIRSWGQGLVSTSSDPSGTTGVVTRVIIPVVNWVADLVQGLGSTIGSLLVPKGVLVTILCLVACTVGLVLPDVDNPGSRVGRLLHVPSRVRHRTLPHTLWLVVLLVLSGWWLAWQYLTWLGVGVLIHQVLDSWSKAGWVPLYPLGQWEVVTLGDGTQCVVSKRAGRTRLSHLRYGGEDGPSETVYVIAVAVVCALLNTWMLW